MKTSLGYTLLINCLLGSLILNPAYARSYKVKSGDNLTGILYREVPGPIYGKNNNLEKIIQLNPNVKPHKILPQTEIQLPQGIGEYTQYELQNGKQNFNNEIPVAEESTKDTLKEVDLTNNFQPRKIDTITEAPSIGEKPFRKTEENSSSSFYLSPLLSYSILKSDQGSGSSANAVSDLSFGLSASWKHFWSEHWQSKIFLEHQSFSYEVSSNKTLADNSSIRSSMGFAGIYKTNFHSFEIQLNYSQKPFLRGPSSSSLDLEAVQAMGLGLEWKYLFLERRDLSAKLFLPFKYDLSGTGPNISTDGGLSYGIGASIEQSFEWGILSSSISYSTESNAFDSTNTSNQLLFISFGMSYYTGANNEK